MAAETIVALFVVSVALGVAFHVGGRFERLWWTMRLKDGTLVWDQERRAKALSRAFNERN